VCKDTEAPGRESGPPPHCFVNMVSEQKNLKQLIADSPQSAHTFRTLKDTFSSQKLCRKQRPAFLPLLVLLQLRRPPLAPVLSSRVLARGCGAGFFCVGHFRQKISFSPHVQYEQPYHSGMRTEDVPIFGCFPAILVRSRSDVVLCHLLGLKERFRCAEGKGTPLFSLKCYAALPPPFLIK